MTECPYFTIGLILVFNKERSKVKEDRGRSGGSISLEEVTSDNSAWVFPLGASQVD